MSENNRIVTMRYLPWQLEARDYVVNRGIKTLLLACGARSGKDVLSAQLAVEMAFRLAMERSNEITEYSKTPKVSVVVVAQKRELYSQTKLEILRLIPKEIRRQHPRYDWIIVAGDIVFKFKSLYDGEEDIVGDAIDILVFVEASRTNKDGIAYEQSLQPRLYSPGCYGLAILSGTPRNAPGHWYRDLYERIEEGRVMNAKAYRLPSYVANPFMAHPNVLKNLKSQMSPMHYAVEIDAQWPMEGMAVFKQRILEECTVHDTTCMGFTKYSIGIDPARSADATAIAVVGFSKEIGITLVHAEWITDTNVMDQIEHIAHIWTKFRHAHITVDATAFGGKTFYDLVLNMVGNPKYITKFEFTQRSKNELINNMLSLYDAKKIMFAKDRIGAHNYNRLKEEMENFDVAITEDGMPNYHGEHDDMIMAAAMALKGIHGYAANKMSAKTRKQIVQNPESVARVTRLVRGL